MGVSGVYVHHDHPIVDVGLTPEPEPPVPVAVPEPLKPHEFQHPVVEGTAPIRFETPLVSTAPAEDETQPLPGPTPPEPCPPHVYDYPIVD